ncbi:uncharacterized protein LOC120354990 [Nilaparvata lugens]|uniref:uncharacterized protein LOC120354990 n=1 Tax=Nilaparvata lugens TaxID=108931 RepID=UPI00193DA6B4|nr:uncharacterized protein LOC120354990 [Nilaparvata lugens]
MSSPSSSQSFILPDSPPPHQHILNYWQRKAALAAESSAAAPAPSPLSVEPPSPTGEIIIGDSPLQRLAPAPTWAPRHAVLSTQPNKQAVKRRLVFEDEGVLTQSKKRVLEEDSSIVPLLREEEEEVEIEDEMQSESFLRLLNSRTEKPWSPLRELEEGLPYPICDVREASNQHGRRIVLKIRVPGLRTTDVYLPERFTRILSTKDIEN